MNSYHYGIYGLDYPAGEWQTGDFILHLPALDTATRIQTFTKHR